MQAKLTQPRLRSVERVQVTLALELATKAELCERRLEDFEDDDTEMVRGEVLSTGRRPSDKALALDTMRALTELELTLVDVAIDDAMDEAGSERLISDDDATEATELLTGRRIGLSGWVMRICAKAAAGRARERARARGVRRFMSGGGYEHIPM